MKRLPQRLCSWCETSGPAEINCVHCGVAFPTLRHEDLPKPPPVDRYTPAERAAFAQLGPLIAIHGGR